jgi:hypothetical protein
MEARWKNRLTGVRFSCQDGVKLRLHCESIEPRLFQQGNYFFDDFLFMYEEEVFVLCWDNWNIPLMVDHAEEVNLQSYKYKKIHYQYLLQLLKLRILTY